MSCRQNKKQIQGMSNGHDPSPPPAHGVDGHSEECCVLLRDVASLPQFHSFQTFLLKDEFRSLSAREFIKDSSKRDALFHEYVHKELDRAQLFCDFVMEATKASFRTHIKKKVAPLMHHSYPPACPDSTCPYLLLDRNDDDPRHWRVHRENRCSGSGQFGMRGFTTLWDRILRAGEWRKIVVLDLRQEPHGFVDLAFDDVATNNDKNDKNDDFGVFRQSSAVFSPGPYLACCWMTQHDFGAAGLSDQEAKQLEDTFVRMLRRQVEVQVGWPSLTCQQCERPLPRTQILKGVMSEKQLVRSQERSKYVRLWVTDHCRPNDHTVDAFVDLVRRHYRNSDFWLHIHCHGGDGRTTTFMCMLDMLINSTSNKNNNNNSSPSPPPPAKDLSFKDFSSRQKALYSYDLEAVPSNPKFSFKVPYAIQRREFLEVFHAYCVESDPLTTGVIWSNWLRVQQKSPHEDILTPSLPHFHLGE